MATQNNVGYWVLAADTMKACYQLVLGGGWLR
jgi:hypothetical protein